MTDAEAQSEEREVLLSIYEGDSAFKELNPTTYQYKFGEDNNPKSFLLEILWGSKYPSEKPTINMETFYNKHIVQKVKEKVRDYVDAEAKQWLGCAMTYSLFQSVQEHLAELTADQPHTSIDMSDQVSQVTINDEQQTDEAAKKFVKKEQLTKAQKRRQWNRVDAKGEKPRGWDWVDIVRHLSQTGSKPDNES
ncbi:hypothetical protein HCN44_007732 [Aphidius gifuensis]|uniref:RWD domain-containing protein n=1 Tax=Aphidius gifuensis TaxID=684658 RepID=A0A834XLQ9_APHGI|nr:RWD domain-containing protein 4 [Aphidius gifuensis]KAF7989202.1 hypothetical protein HCN44_007732 [Aphidius gifuensis]